MKYLLPLILVLVGCGQSWSPPSFAVLKDYKVSCETSTSQIAYLNRIVAYKNFGSDPDLLNEQDREYNKFLKTKLWWFYQNCDIQ